MLVYERRFCLCTVVFGCNLLQIAKGNSCQVIMADLNTMANGIARLSPNYCCDSLRFWSLGQSEAEWWHRNIFSTSDSSPSPPPNAKLLRSVQQSKNPYGACFLVSFNVLYIIRRHESSIDCMIYCIRYGSLSCPCCWFVAKIA